MRRTFESFLIRADEEKEPRRVVAEPEERTGASYIFLGINFNISARSLHTFLHLVMPSPDNKTNNISRSSSSDFSAKG